MKMKLRLVAPALLEISLSITDNSIADIMVLVEVVVRAKTNSW